MVTPVAQATAPAPTTPPPAPEPRTVERLIADRHAEQSTLRANQEREPSRSGSEAGASERAPRAPAPIDIEKTLRSLDAASKAIDQRTKAATDSATTIRLQAPTFQKVRMSDPTKGPVVP